MRNAQLLASALCLTLLSACSGGGGSSSPTTTATTGGTTTTGGGTTTTGGGTTTTGGGTTTTGGGTTTTGGGTSTVPAFWQSAATSTLRTFSLPAAIGSTRVNASAQNGGASDRQFSVSGATVLNFRESNNADNRRGFQFFSRDSGSDFMLVIEPGSTFNGGTFNHSTFGVWAASSTADLLDNQGGNFENGGGFFLGIETELNQRPTTGTASYRGGAAGLEYDGAMNLLSVLTGTFDAQIDFAAGALGGGSGQMNLQNASSGAQWGTVSTGQLTNINFNGDLRFSGNNFTSSNGHTGSGGGAFFGPNAEEMIGDFNLFGATTVRGTYGGAQ